MYKLKYIGLLLPKFQPRPKTPRYQFGGVLDVRSVICWRYLLEAKCFWIVLTKESAVGAMRIEVHSCLWCWGTKKKDLHSKCSLLFFANRFESSGVFQSAVSKNNWIFRKYMKNEFHRSDFSFLSRGWIGIKHWQNFIKNYVFPVLHIHKNDPIVLYLWHVTDSVDVNMRAKF